MDFPHVKLIQRTSFWKVICGYEGLVFPFIPFAILRKIRNRVNNPLIPGITVGRVDKPHPFITGNFPHRGTLIHSWILSANGLL